MQKDRKSDRFHQEPTTDVEKASESFPEYPSSEFESEITAEDFHRARSASASHGGFSEVNYTSWDHEEADWSIDWVNSHTPIATYEIEGQLDLPYQDRHTSKPKVTSSRGVVDQTGNARSAINEGHIASIQLKNFKKFRGFRLDAGPKNILTGKNNAGKSSILDALRVAHDVLRFVSRCHIP